MDEYERRVLLAAIREWVAKHPAPDDPAIDVGLGGRYSPRQIHNELLEEGSEFGAWFLRVLENGIKSSKLQAVLDGFSARSKDRTAG